MAHRSDKTFSNRCQLFKVSFPGTRRALRKGLQTILGLDLSQRGETRLAAAKPEASFSLERQVGCLSASHLASHKESFRRAFDLLPPENTSR